MVRAGKWVVAVALAVASVWTGFALSAQETKPVDLSALRDAVDVAAKKGENVDEIRKALDAFEKAKPAANTGRVMPELQALRDAVEGAAKKGENVEAVAKELAAVETAIVGRPLAKPKPEPRPDVPPNPFNPPNPLVPFPVVPFPGNPGGGIDAEAFQKGMDLRMKALELMAKNPRDPDARKLLAEANDVMMKAIRPNGGANIVPVFPVFPVFPEFPAFPDAGRVPDRARLGIRLENLAPIASEQLGIDANVGIAVTAVVPGSAAEKAGLKAHDIILEFAGKAVSDNTDDFIRTVNAAKAGEKIDLVVMRKGKKVDIKGVVLPEAGRLPLPRPALPADLPNLFPALPAPAVSFPVRAAAEEPKGEKPDLNELRYTVTAADKRGENVGAITDALTALEKALAKNAAKPGEAPPELTALRVAVESALKKGENVEAIAKELALVEKALTGREYERPKPPEPKVEPVPQFPRRGGFGGGGVVIGGGGRMVIGGGGFNSTSVTISNGNFTVRAKLGDVTYTVTGTADATVAPKITIKDGEKTVETDDLKKVPEEYRPAVERLLKMVNR